MKYMRFSLWIIVLTVPSVSLYRHPRRPPVSSAKSWSTSSHGPWPIVRSNPGEEESREKTIEVRDQRGDEE
jgi:hypothetical protein